MVIPPPFSSAESSSKPPAKKRAAKASKRAADRAAAVPAKAPAKKRVAKAPAKAPVKATTVTKRPAKAARAKAPAAAEQATPAAAEHEAPKQPSTPAPSKRKLGPVESATVKELEASGVAHSALAASAIAMARNVDEAETAAGASAAARELRIVLPLARTTVNPLSPSAASDEPENGDDEGTVVGPTRLDTLRKRAAKRAAK